MTQSKLEYYKESGIASPLNLTLLIISSLLLIIFLSYFYSVLINYLPIIYFNFLIVIGFGFIISLISRIFCILFKIRNEKKTLIITFILSIFAVYFQWVSYLFIISADNFNLFMIFDNLEGFFNILLSPNIVINNIINISETGLWSIGSSGINVNGIFLWIVWITEAILIIAVAFISFKNFKSIPFSEKDNKWFKKQIIDYDFERILFKKEFIKNFIINPFNTINKLKKGNGLRHSKIYIYTSDTETKSIISIDNIIIKQNGKGKKDITSVIKLCYIDNSFLKQIREKYEIKKASFVEF